MNAQFGTKSPNLMPANISTYTVLDMETLYVPCDVKLNITTMISLSYLLYLVLLVLYPVLVL